MLLLPLGIVTTDQNKIVQRCYFRGQCQGIHTQTGKAMNHKLVDVSFNKKSKSKFMTIGKKQSDFFAGISCR